MAVHRRLGTTGFSLSALVDIMLLLPTPPTLLVALFIYPISIITRSLAWTRLSKVFRNGFYRSTGLVVLAFGIIVFIIFSPIGRAIIPPILEVPVFLWTIYSLFEIASYSKLKTYTKRFNFARISVLGMTIIVAVVSGLRGGLFVSPEASLGYVRIAFVFLTISAILAALGFRKLPERLE